VSRWTRTSQAATTAPTVNELAKAIAAASTLDDLTEVVHVAHNVFGDEWEEQEAVEHGTGRVLPLTAILARAAVRITA
jgi:hypothetical protein